MQISSLIGSVGATLTTISQLPQLFKVYKTKQTKDLSLSTYLVLFVGVCLWAIYGLALNEPPIYIANIVTGLLVLGVLIYKIKFG